jgi:hypothetical protein
MTGPDQHSHPNIGRDQECKYESYNNQVPLQKRHIFVPQPAFDVEYGENRRNNKKGRPQQMETGADKKFPKVGKVIITGVE